MKIYIIAIFNALVINIMSYAQSPQAMFYNPNVYRTNADFKAVRLVKENDFTIVYNDTFTIKAGINTNEQIDYRIVKDDENGYTIIRVLPRVKLIKEIDQNGKVTNQVIRVNSNELLTTTDSVNAWNYYFAVKKDEFPPLGKRLMTYKITGEPLVHPFKLRPPHKNAYGSEGWNLGSEFTVSYVFGLKMRITDNPFKDKYLSVVPYGFGVGTAEYFVKPSDDKKDVIAVTYYQGGVLLHLNKINIGAFIGYDAMVDRSNNWFYQGLPWFSLGLGYNFKTE